MDNPYTKIKDDTQVICLFYEIDFTTMYKQVMEYAKKLGVSYNVAKAALACEIRQS